jgi:hypothetical protein
MKKQIKVIMLFIFVILIAILGFMGYRNMTGFAVLDSSGVNLTNNVSVVTKSEAAFAINQSEKIIFEMIQNNFSITYMNDSLIEAKKIFEQVGYAEILKGEVIATEKEKENALFALRLINWKKVSYADVLAYTDRIIERRQKAFFLADKITIEESNIGFSKTTMDLLNQAKIAFYEDRYNDSETLLNEFVDSVEREKLDASFLSGVKNGTLNFIQKYWIEIIIFLVIFIFIFNYFYKKAKKRALQKKIDKIKAEKGVLEELMKKNQEDRFKKNSISGLVYNIRMKKYQERIEEIKQELPVFEERLKKDKA